jgi:hypothetical protein
MVNERLKLAIRALVSPKKILATFLRVFGRPIPDRHVSSGGGIGLALVRELTAATGGNVSAESELGRGSTFRATIPAAMADGKHSLRKRSPGLERDSMQPTIFNQSFTGIPKVWVFHVNVDGRIVKHRAKRIIFDLIHYQRLFDRRFQQLDLGRGMVAHAEVSDLACPIQAIDGLCDFRRFDQYVRAMQK